MATLTSSGVVFGDGSSLTSAAPAQDAVGSKKFGFYTASIAAPVGNDTFVGNITNFSIGTTIGGGSLASDMYVNSVQSGYLSTAFVGWGTSAAVMRRPSGRTSSAFFSSGTNTFANSWIGVGQAAGNTQNSILYSTNTTYSTNSGSWRALNSFTHHTFLTRTRTSLSLVGTDNTGFVTLNQGETNDRHERIRGRYVSRTRLLCRGAKPQVG